MMRRSSVALIGTAALLGGLAGAPALGAPIGQSLGLRADGQNPIEQVQFFWNGYDYCWYDGGWHGPGWYVCEYGPWVSGFWWGGPLGWNNWRVGRFDRRFEDRRFDDRRFREGRTFVPAPGRQFTGPSTGRTFTGPSPDRSFANGPSGPSRQFSGPSGQFGGSMSRGPGPGSAGPATVGRGPGPSGPSGSSGPSLGGGGRGRQ